LRAARNPFGPTHIFVSFIGPGKKTQMLIRARFLRPKSGKKSDYSDRPILTAPLPSPQYFDFVHDWICFPNYFLSKNFAEFTLGKVRKTCSETLVQGQNWGGKSLGRGRKFHNLFPWFILLLHVVGIGLGHVLVHKTITHNLLQFVTRKILF
jgi:hypothetical protein